MQTRRVFGIALSALLAVGACLGQAGAQGQPSELWQGHELKDLLEKGGRSESPWLPFLRVPSLSMGLYSLPAGGQDKQSPHERDEVYYVVSGKAVLRIGDEDHPVEEGSIVYVRAKAEHHFHSIEKDLKVLVFFSSADPGPPPRPDRR